MKIEGQVLALDLSMKDRSRMVRSVLGLKDRERDAATGMHQSGCQQARLHQSSPLLRILAIPRWISALPSDINTGRPWRTAARAA